MKVLAAALPEFLGSLGAGLLYSLGALAVRRLRRRIAPGRPTPATAPPPDSQ
ncbi:hypothetical protein ACFWZ2_43135 [Streptomyces sp. NPDC059002]|uniref:hypothetical protein n=1 Tax=Streptomyces sp. NPDC059002 TaxID=3346690 RepID=UPI0036C74563